MPTFVKEVIQIIRDTLVGRGGGTMSPNDTRGEKGGSPNCHVTFFSKILCLIFEFGSLFSSFYLKHCFWKNQNVASHGEGVRGMSQNDTWGS